MAINIRVILAVFVLFSVYSSSHAVPLSTKSRWVIDDKTGKRVKLVCANLVGHAESMLPEGLSKQPLRDMVRRTAMMGFNCIRLTYAADMFTRDSHVTVYNHFKKLGLQDALDGISEHNLHLLDQTLVQAQRAVVHEFSSQGMMLILDNQVSKPMWCCADKDGNGFFGDTYFDPQEWLHSLTTVAKLYRHNPMVVGMSLRNEIRGPNQTESVWREYILKGAKAVHKANPNLLVIISGISYAIRLGFLKDRPLELNFKNKLMYETHRYAFSDGNTNQFLQLGKLNENCRAICKGIDDDVGFLSREPNAAPIFVSEFGLNQVGNITSDNTFFACFLSYLAENDFEWALWTLQGSYYYRQGLKDPEELYGMFNSAWNAIRNPDVNSKLQLIGQVLQDPFSNSKEYNVMFHPWSGKCLRVDGGSIHLSDCFGMARFRAGNYSNPSPLELHGSGGCLTGMGDGKPVAITKDCNSKRSSWREYNKYQLAHEGDDGKDMCLDWDPSYSLKIVTKECIHFEDRVEPKNPQKQWFNLIRATAD